MQDRFTLSQLSQLAAKFRAASSDDSISVEAFKQIMCRQGSASFDTSKALLPKEWLPLAAHNYQRLGERYCSAGSNKLGWPEVIVSLAGLEPITENAIIEMLRAATSIIGQTDLSAEATSEEPSPPLAGLRLSRDQMAHLPLWFETGEVQANGFSFENAAKALLCDMMLRDDKIDLQQLLLYCCDSPAQAFAVLGYQTQSMLSLEEMYELFHRESRHASIDLPDYADYFSRTALRRLFAQLKLHESERAPYGLVVAHPAGSELLAQCVSYKPKDPYQIVADELATAGDALKL